MNQAGARRTMPGLAMLIAVCVVACTPTVVIPNAPVCAMPTGKSAEPCPAPLEIQAAATYGDLLTSYQADRRDLIDCHIRQKELLDLMAACNDVMTKYNKDIQGQQAKVNAGH